MAKNKSVYEIMGDVNELIKPDDYQVHASANPQDHYVAPKDVNVRLAESKDLKKAKTMGALAQTVGKGFQQVAQIKDVIDKDRIEMESYDMNVLGLKNEREYTSWMINNQSEYEAMDVAARAAKKQEFFEESFGKLEGTHEKVQIKFNDWFLRGSQKERLDNISSDFDRYVAIKAEEAVNGLTALDTNTSIEVFNKAANTALLNLAGITKLPVKELNTYFAKLGVANLANDDARLYNFANSQKLYGTAEAIDSGLSGKATKAFYNYEQRTIKENLKEDASLVADATAAFPDSASKLSVALADAETKNDKRDNEYFVDYFDIVNSQVAANNFDGLNLLEQMEDGDGRKLMEHPFYAKQQAVLAGHLDAGKKETFKQRKVHVANGIADDFFANNRNVYAKYSNERLNPNDPENPLDYKTLKPMVDSEILKRYDAALDQFEDDDPMKIMFQRAHIQRFHDNKIVNPKWQHQLTTAANVIQTPSALTPVTLEQTRQALDLYQEINTISPDYITSDKTRTAFNTILTHQELQNSTLEAAIVFANQPDISLSEEDLKELTSELAETGWFGGSDLDAKDNMATIGLEAASAHAERLMRKGIRADIAVQVTKDNYLTPHYEVVKANGTKRLIDKRGFVSDGLHPNYYAWMPKFIKDVEDEMRIANDDDNLTYTLKRVSPKSNDYVFMNNAGNFDVVEELSNGMTTPKLISAEDIIAYATAKLALNETPYTKPHNVYNMD